MKKITTLLVVALISLSCLAQKKELKVAQSALDNNNYTEALTALNSAESLLDGAKDKYKTQYYFLLGKALYANGTTPDSFEKSAEAFNTLFDLEKEGSLKYTNDATAIINTMIAKVNNQANSDYSEGIVLSKSPDTSESSIDYFRKAGQGFTKVFILSEKDTAFLQNSALAYYFSKDYKESLKNYQKLIDLGYTGINTIYSAISSVTGKEVGYASKKEMDKQVKMKLATDPKIDVRKSQRNGIIKMIAKNYISLQNNEKALEAIQEAQKETPDDYGLLVDEANVYFAMGNNLKFKEKLEMAVKLNPTDPMLHYNIGVMKMELKENEGAILSFKKAIELKPNYIDAYNNLGVAILAKAQPIVEEMNKNLSNFTKYDQLQAKQLDIYKEALPYYEKVYEMDSTSRHTIQTLMGIYENLEMVEKAKEIREVYDNLK